MLICVTNRHLCNDFLMQIKKIAQAKPDAILLREKDLSCHAYQALYAQCESICKQYDVALIPHFFVDNETVCVPETVHLPYDTFQGLAGTNLSNMRVGVSVHSVAQAKQADRLGASYLIAGHIFKTNCKRNVLPRGLGFLQEVCNAVTIPVYAIGGITPESTLVVLKQGVAGVCVMSAFMQADKPEIQVSDYRRALRTES